MRKAKYINPYTDFDFKKRFREDYRDLKGVIDTSFEEGEKKKAKEIARKMKDKGIEIESISEITGLSKEEIDKL